MSDRKTFAEQLDAARTGEEFGGVVRDIFTWLETLKDQETDDE